MKELFFFCQGFKLFLKWMICIGTPFAVIMIPIHIAMHWGYIREGNFDDIWVWTVVLSVLSIGISLLIASIVVFLDSYGTFKNRWKLHLVEKEENKALEHKRKIELIEAARPQYIQPLPEGWRDKNLYAEETPTPEPQKIQTKETGSSFHRHTKRF